MAVNVNKIILLHSAGSGYEITGLDPWDLGLIVESLKQYKGGPFSEEIAKMVAESLTKDFEAILENRAYFKKVSEDK